MTASLLTWLVLAGVALLVYGALRRHGNIGPSGPAADFLFGALVGEELQHEHDVEVQHEHDLEQQEEHEHEQLDEEDDAF